MSTTLGPSRGGRTQKKIARPHSGRHAETTECGRAIFFSRRVPLASASIASGLPFIHLLPAGMNACEWLGNTKTARMTPIAVKAVAHWQPVTRYSTPVHNAAPVQQPTLPKVIPVVGGSAASFRARPEQTNERDALNGINIHSKTTTHRQQQQTATTATTTTTRGQRRQ